jgi:hypothetical protein
MKRPQSEKKPARAPGNSKAKTWWMTGGVVLAIAVVAALAVVGTRGKGEVSTGSNHLGFRCVQSAGPREAGADKPNHRS